MGVPGKSSVGNLDADLGVTDGPPPGKKTRRSIALETSKMNGTKFRNKEEGKESVANKRILQHQYLFKGRATTCRRVDTI